MEIIIEGHKVDTKDIWDIELITDSRYVGIRIRVIDKPDILIGRKIAYETYSSEYSNIYAPYKKLYSEVKEKWELDKTELQIFKL